MPANTVKVVARVVAKPESVGKVLSILSALLEPTRQEPGCISYQLLHNRADPTDFTFVEEWESDAAIDAHLTTNHICEALTKLPGLISGEPDIRKYGVVSLES